MVFRVELDFNRFDVLVQRAVISKSMATFKVDIANTSWKNTLSEIKFVRAKPTDVAQIYSFPHQAKMQRNYMYQACFFYSVEGVYFNRAFRYSAGKVRSEIVVNCSLLTE